MIDLKDLNIRVIDQRIGAGIGGLDTVIRIYHKPTGLLVEVPRLASIQFKDRALGINMIEAGLDTLDWFQTGKDEAPTS